MKTLENNVKSIETFINFLIKIYIKHLKFYNIIILLIKKNIEKQKN